jgi:hypothetical protein
VQAWEPWNEANVQTFGGHTVDQMCAWQKAAWFGFKAGDPHLVVGWNVVTTVPTDQHAEGLALNGGWAYFDTYNIHTYDWAHDYANLWGPARATAGGKPLGVTESDRGSKLQNDPPWFDLSPRDERLKAEYIAQSYAQSFFAGASRHFHFIVGHYHEPSGVQFGLLRRDFTPRPAYVALAAVGRLLAGAECLGRWEPEPDLHLYAFRAQPDGQPRDVLVAWTEQPMDWQLRGGKKQTWSPPEAPEVRGVFDFLGRPQDGGWPRELTSAPTFIVLRAGSARRLPLEPPPTGPQARGDRVCPIVLQLLTPREARARIEDKPWSEAWACAVREGQASRFSLCAYHFGKRQAAGRLELSALPSGWRVSPVSLDLTLQPMDRLTRELVLEVPVGTARDGWVQFRGDFGRPGNSTLAFRIVVRGVDR